MKSVSITVLSIAVYLLMPVLMFVNAPGGRAVEAAPVYDPQIKAPIARADEDREAKSVDFPNAVTSFAASLPVTAAEELELMELEPYIYLPSNELVLSGAQVEGSAKPVHQIQDNQLEAFAGTLASGARDEAVGVYVPGLFALPIMQQPGDQAAYVSNRDDMITQFSMPTRYGTTGLLAHNYLSGMRFFELEVGQDFVIIHGDGHRDYYRVSQIQEYQALTPNSPYSQFIDLDDPSQQVLSAGELFKRVYTTAGQVVFQTCIEAFGDPSWGRIFVIAEQIEG